MESKQEIEIKNTIRQIKQELNLLDTIRKHEKYDYKPEELLNYLKLAKTNISNGLLIIERE